MTDRPLMAATREVAPETFCLPSVLPVPGHGVLPVNAFLVRGTEPVLVDTGLAALRDEALAAVRGLLDPAELRWIWLSHMDWDHIGNLAALLEAAPRARLVTGFLGAGKLMLAGLPVDRVHMVEPDGRLEAGDRTLHALRPPYYDAPETTGFVDSRTRALFAADAFGALLGAPAETAEEVPDAALRDGMLGWAAIDAPWLRIVDRSAFGAALREVERIAPSVVLSGHLPPARGALLPTLLRGLHDTYAEPRPAAAA